MEKLFATCMTAAALIVAGSVFYHLVVFLPMTHERESRRAEHVRVIEHTVAVAQVRCKESARRVFDARRDAVCRDATLAGKQRHETCVQDALLSSNPDRKVLCDATLARDTEQCLVPPTTVNALEAMYEKEEQACLQETA